MRFLPLFLLLAACSTVKNTSSADADLVKLQDQMSGYFTSADQAGKDKDYYDISLHMTPIWKDRKGEYWLYVEQAMATKLDKPYRQRVYRLEKEGDNLFKSTVYTLANEQKFIGAWKDSKLFATVKPGELSLRDGCTVHLNKQTNGNYTGGTKGEGCESNLRGAKYATSKVTITAKGIESWDQGFDTAGKQVWGATKGPYVFVKQ